MSKQKKSMTVLDAEIARLIQQREELKEEKLNVFLGEFRKAFKRKDFQEAMLNADNVALKEAAKAVINDFANIIRHSSTAHELNSQPVHADETANAGSLDCSCFGK